MPPNTQCAGSKLPALLSHEISRLPVLPALAPRAPRTRTAAMSAPPARPRAATSDQRLHSARVAARNPDILQMPNYRALTHTCVGRVVTSLGSQVRKLRPRKAKRLDQVAQLARGRARLHASATGSRGTAVRAPTPGSRLRRSRLSPSGTCSPRRPRVRLCPIRPHRASRAESRVLDSGLRPAHRAADADSGARIPAGESAALRVARSGHVASPWVALVSRAPQSAAQPARRDAARSRRSGPACGPPALSRVGLPAAPLPAHAAAFPRGSSSDALRGGGTACSSTGTPPAAAEACTQPAPAARAGYVTANKLTNHVTKTIYRQKNTSNVNNIWIRAP